VSDNVVGLRGVVPSQGKQTLLDTVAVAYDELAKHGEPVCVVFAVVAEKGACRTGYHTLSPIDDRNCLYISRAATAIMADLANVWDETD
jgi:hypothetical protein